MKIKYKKREMTNSKYLFIRVTKIQHERIRNNAEAKGFKTISSYIRTIALEYDLNSQKKIDEMYEIIKI